MEAQIDALVGQLQEKNNTLACGAMKTLLALSETSGKVYPYWDTFAGMLGSDSSYMRTRGLLLLAANVKWDTAERILPILPEFLSHVMDEKPITARQFIQALPAMVRAKPALAAPVRRALTEADPYRYPESMAGLVEKDLLASLKAIAGICPGDEESEQTA